MNGTINEIIKKELDKTIIKDISFQEIQEKILAKKSLIFYDENTQDFSKITLKGIICLDIFDKYDIPCDDFVKEIKKKNIISYENVKIINVLPKISPSSPILIPENNFFNSFYIDDIFAEYKKFHTELTENNFFIIYQKTEINNVYVLLNVCMEKDLHNSICYLLDEGISFHYFSYASYLKERKNYQSLSINKKENKKVLTGIDFIPLKNKENNSYKKNDIQNNSFFKMNLLEELKFWLKNTSFNDFYHEISKRVIGQESLKTITAIIYNYIFCIVNEITPNNNILLAAPSGCGKTETYRTIKDYFNQKIGNFFPVSQVDMTSITEEGYTGGNTKDIVISLLEEETDGIGIIFLDEFDKKLVPSYSKQGRNVNLAVQSQILTLLEGRVLEFQDKKIDTNNTLFIACGSFDECRGKKETKKSSIGFTKELIQDEVSHYDEITREDIIELGGSYEIIGRFPYILNYHSLTTESVNKIIDLLVSNNEKEFRLKISIEDTYRELLQNEANGSYGCRIINDFLKNDIMDAYIKILESESDLYKDHKIILSDKGKYNIIYPADESFINIFPKLNTIESDNYLDSIELDC